MGQERERLRGETENEEREKRERRGGRDCLFRIRTERGGKRDRKMGKRQRCKISLPR